MTTLTRVLQTGSVRILQSIKFAAILLLGFAAHTLAKPGAAINLLGPSSYSLEAYSNETIELEFSLPANAETLAVHMHTQDEILVLSPQAEQEINLQATQTRLSMPIQIETTENGVYYLMFNFVLGYPNGATEARTMGIRLQVGEVAVQKQEKLQKSENKNEPAIKASPAQETVSP